MSPEGEPIPGAPGAEEEGQPGEERPVPPSPETPEETRKPWFRWPKFRRQRAETPLPPGIESDLREIESDVGQPLTPERLETLSHPKTPEDLVHLMSIINGVQLRELKLNEKHGEGRLGWVRKFLAGERDFDLTEDGQIRRNSWQELGRKALVTVFNRKTALAAGTLGVIGIFTGGVGLPAGMALAGMVVGRGAAEAWESIRGEERGLREEIAQKHYEGWSDLRELALESQNESLSQEERHQALTQLIEDFHKTSAPVKEREEEFKEVRQRWDKRRNMLMAVGGIAGLGAGIWIGFQGLSQMATRLDLDADGVYHHVEKINNVWYFAYNSAQETLRDQLAGATVWEHAGQLVHEVGPDAAKILPGIAKNLLPEAGRVAGVFAGLGFGALWARKAEAGRPAEESREEARQERRYREGKERLMGQVPETGPVQPAAEPAKKETVQKTEQKVIDLDKEVEKLQSELEGKTVEVTFKKTGGKGGKYWARPEPFRGYRIEFADEKEKQTYNQEIQSQETITDSFVVERVVKEKRKIRGEEKETVILKIKKAESSK